MGLLYLYLYLELFLMNEAAGRVVMLITQLHLVPQIRVCGVKDALSHMTKLRAHKQQ
jgi:hypothetical protein